jgi:hypothetical protein
MALSNKAIYVFHIIGDTAYGSPPEPVIGPAIAGPVGGDDVENFIGPYFPNNSATIFISSASRNGLRK